MRRRMCTAACRSCCLQVQHVIDRYPSQLSPTIPICALHTSIRRPVRGGVRRTIAMAFDAENQNGLATDAEKI